MRKEWAEERWGRIARYRIREGVREGAYREKEEDRRLQGACGGEEEHGNTFGRSAKVGERGGMGGAGGGDAGRGGERRMAEEVRELQGGKRKSTSFRISVD